MRRRFCLVGGCAWETIEGGGGGSSHSLHTHTHRTNHPSSQDLGRINQDVTFGICSAPLHFFTRRSLSLLSFPRSGGVTHTQGMFHQSMKFESWSVGEGGSMKLSGLQLSGFEEDGTGRFVWSLCALSVCVWCLSLSLFSV